MMEGSHEDSLSTELPPCTCAVNSKFILLCLHDTCDDLAASLDPLVTRVCAESGRLQSAEGLKPIHEIKHVIF